MINSVINKISRDWKVKLSRFICQYPFLTNYIFNPKKQMEKDYKSVFKKNISWDNPIDLVEKIDWLQLYSDTSLWTRCADKYRVREYVKERGCGYCLNELYGKWDRVEDIDWDTLPDQFVMKSNNGSGEVCIIKDKSKLNINEISRKLKKLLNEKYGAINGQIHYTHIKPCIIAERFIENHNNPNASIIDYKLYCFNGTPDFFFVVYDRVIGGQHPSSSFDLQWNNISEKIYRKDSSYFGNKPIPKPESFNEMLLIAKKLSTGIPEVRIDFYDVEGKAVFGEMTFTSGFDFYTPEYYEYLGKKVDVSNVIKLEKTNRIG